MHGWWVRQVDGLGKNLKSPPLKHWQETKEQDVTYAFLYVRHFKVYVFDQQYSISIKTSVKDFNNPTIKCHKFVKLTSHCKLSAKPQFYDPDLLMERQNIEPTHDNINAGDIKYKDKSLENLNESKKNNFSIRLVNKR